ncbi:PilT/PilU family type 4a pilus ATPase [Candidatus Nomurabacteria bacterium]|nr:PilT/PilU family type 4a pilus ATPase [Candidatus Nomurabacteria bacterium]
MIQKLLSIVKSQGASDLHVSVGRYPYIRVNGDLIALRSENIVDQDMLLRMLVELVGEDRARRVLNKEEIDFAYEYAAENIRFRGSAYIRAGYPTFTLRAIERIRALDELNLPDQLLDFANKEQGFFIIVGPVGQGKSTTMAALLEYINQNRQEHIVTIENPIEYIFDEKQSIIDQREVGIDTHSFESGLKAMFRQDVNVMMVGEMRSPDTIKTAVTAAETGHLVFSTLHTNNASQTIDRIIDSFPAEQQDQIRVQLSNTLLGIFSQRLIPSLQGGRVPAYELLINNDAVANLIREGRTHEIDSVIETSRSQGMIDMNHSLLALVRNGHVTLDDAMRYSLNPKGLQQLM